MCIRACLALVLVFACVLPARAATSGSLKGVVHDPQHRPVAGADVTLKAARADLVLTVTTDADGQFQFTGVPVGDYVVSVARPGFEASVTPVTILSGAAPDLHVQLQLAALTDTATVTATADTARQTSVTPTSLVNRDDIAGTPGAARTNSLSMITGFVPGSYMVHDQLHLRGGHQVSWLIDGVPIPNTSIASNVGPQVDPKDIDYLEVQRGSYDAQYGDRTYGVFNVVPRTGFERNRELEVVASAGSFRQTNDQISIGDHTSRVAYYGSLTFNRSDLGLETPVAQTIHDSERGLGGFGSLILNLDSGNQLRLVTSSRRDRYEIPVSPDDRAAGIADLEQESDTLVTLSWLRSIGSKALLTVSPFYHDNRADYLGGPADAPTRATVKRRSQYAGAQVTFNVRQPRNDVQLGFYGFHQRDTDLFAVEFNDGGGANLADREAPSGKTAVVFMQDTVTPTSWLTLTAGVRATRFAGGVTETAISPRLGASARIPRWGVVVRGFYGRFYQGPPLVTASGPLVDFVTAQSLGFIPLPGERDREYQIGATIPIAGWTVDAGRFQTRAVNFFDHNSVGNSNVFFPLTIAGAVTRGWELAVRSPRAWQRGQLHLAYARQVANGLGAITGGLTDFSPASDEVFPLDHDQRHTLSVGGQVRVAQGLVAAATVTYGSGFPDGESGNRLPGHSATDLSISKAIGRNLAISAQALNVTNKHLLVDNSLTFGGTHFNHPREVYAEVRYRFHY